jgi:hypothetical protein
VFEDSDRVEIVVNKYAHDISPGKSQHNDSKEFFDTVEVGNVCLRY